MIDLKHEKLITFSVAARLLPVPIHRATVGRWADFGARGVVLESTNIGGRKYTSPEALQRFLDQCQVRNLQHGYLSPDLYAKLPDNLAQLAGELPSAADRADEELSTNKKPMRRSQPNGHRRGQP